jgi:Tfp pilus assembly protein PilF
VLFNLLGICLIELNDHSNADKAFESSLKMNRNFSEAAFNQVLCAQKQGNIARAKMLFGELERSCSDEGVKDRLLNLKPQLSS